VWTWTLWPLTIGFARRATAYKRATLIFSDLEKLREASRLGAIQLVFPGRPIRRTRSASRRSARSTTPCATLKGR